MFTQLFGLFAKEFWLLWSDRRSRLTLIIPPLLQLIVFGYAATFNVDHAPIAIFNEDTGPYGRELSARFSGSTTFQVTALPTTERQIRPLIDNAEVMMALHIGQRFSAELHAGRPPNVQVILDGRRLTTALTVQSYATAIIAAFNKDYVAANGFDRPAAATVTRAWFNPGLESHWFILPGLVAKLVLIATLTIAVSIARERELGSFDRMFALGLSPFQILAAKSAAPVTIGFLQGVVMSALAAFWFGVPFRGSIGLLLLCILVFVVAATGIGIMLSARAKTQRQATLRVFLFVVLAIMLSGFATPISSMPEALRAVTYLDPLRYCNLILRALFLRDVSWDFYWAQLWPLAVIGLVTFTASYILIRPARA